MVAAPAVIVPDGPAAQQVVPVVRTAAVPRHRSSTAKEEIKAICLPRRLPPGAHG
ncbi:hypothetical protein GCM10010129_40130 [Streptomyces fumigatiscleroticus]|nr:hypothetical protein GCM10010129_40130 [Streptomyces fumigatiscleroticus]